MNLLRNSKTVGRRRISGLLRLIVLFNAAALVVLIAGLMLIQARRAGLVDERMTGIRQEASIVAGALAEYATDKEARAIDTDDAEPLLRALIAPTSLRARLYDTDGKLVIDSRDLLARNIVQMAELPPLDFRHQARAAIRRVYDVVMGVRPFAKLKPYFEAGDNGRVYSEVDTALKGDTAGAERVDEQNKLVLSLATPIERFKTIYGVLMVSTEGGDIDDILRQERASLIGISLVAFAVMFVSSLYLSGAIALPVRQLAAAADRVKSGHGGRETIPALAGRNDEIGDLAASLSAMTRALYDRIDSIERFAADVAHELKNPLTSLKSAVEMFARTQDEAMRANLMVILRNDIRRIDRLISDISDASRLDAELSREAREPVDLTHLLNTIIEVYRLTQLPRGVQLSLAIDLPAKAYVLGRDERIGQIFRNLIDNAISFSPDGATVRLEAASRAGIARVTVEDEGPGIPPENLESVFDRFYTERPVEHGFGKNSGLGLSIARQIVEGVGGRIWAENCVQPIGTKIGARFTVELPLAGKG